MIETALKLALQWKWNAQKAKQLKADLKAYYQCKSPFSGGQRNARDWWEDVPKENHDGIRSMGIVLACIVPHSGDVERLFSDLGGIQTPRRNSMTVANMEKTGKIRSRLNYELYLAEKAKAGKTVHRKHNHMHTQATPGINTDLAKDLENPITWIPPLDGDDDNNTEDLVEKAYQELNRTIEDEGTVAASEPGAVVNGEVVDFGELERVERGESIGAEEENIDIVGNDVAGEWSIADIMQQ
ncbi:hypothetical protein B0H10DRAFT_1950965 [Mycena sp. CBHHK59/15]|nr:hypothetical protein B0H10DRAFT_1950965 [Mycena sp. CBHHK59/15]